MRCGLANFDAVRHQLDVCLFNVFSAHFQAVLIQRDFAFVATFITGFDTVFHVFVYVCHVVHLKSSYGNSLGLGFFSELMS